jgi:hypothetical protein
MSLLFIHFIASATINSSPDDVLQNIDPTILVISIPIFDKSIYPTLRRFNIKFISIPRITCGFLNSSYQKYSQARHPHTQDDSAYRKLLCVWPSLC